MTKQEEIKGGIADIVFRQTMALLGADFAEEYSTKDFMYGKVASSKILDYLHSQGVVLKAWGELPENPYPIEGVETYQEGKRVAFNRAISDMLKAGYTLTEPLIQKSTVKLPQVVGRGGEANDEP